MTDSDDFSRPPEDAKPAAPAPDSTPPLLRVLQLVFGISRPVGPLAYAASGFSLMLLKYGVEALVVWVYADGLFMPWDFVNPLLSTRLDILRPVPEPVAWALFAWSIPFMWVAITMSVRRAANSGASPWLGLIVLVPLVNLLFMLVMCVLPSAPGDQWSPSSRTPSETNRTRSSAIGIGASLLVGALMLLVSVYVFESYGASLFLGTPLLMGATAGYLHNREQPRGLGGSIGIGLSAVFFAGLALLLFALEGAICIAMAAPLILPIGALGGLIGKAIADATRRPGYELMAAVVILPLLAGAEAMFVRTAEYDVTSAVEIDAPPEVVWRHVVHFPDLPEPDEWYFRLGIACPQRARIEGEGVGATRFCEFTTGTFVEPITVWDAPHRLAFDVTDQPAPMFELSPYRHVHPPHLDGYLRSNRGEFRLIRLPGGRTRLEGRTWYEFEMFPQEYWTLWSDSMIHRIHLRVLRHVKKLAENGRAGDI